MSPSWAFRDTGALPIPATGVGGVSLYHTGGRMTVECLGGPWDGEHIAAIGRVLAVVPVAGLPEPDTNAQRHGCYVLTARGYEWEADE